ncbi:hypothetical protein HanIR_Chr16g0829181 [Helianthus annuus]|nr:hypothetical protein HanIR_Chr16g0829181 [Helianthus annuus]
MYCPRIYIFLKNYISSKYTRKNIFLTPKNNIFSGCQKYDILGNIYEIIFSLLSFLK